MEEKVENKLIQDVKVEVEKKFEPELMNNGVDPNERRLVSIVIPAYKAMKTLRTTLASIQVQSYLNKIEVIIVNDSPKDDEYNYYDAYKKIASEYPEIKILLINTDKNCGPGIARQKGLQYIFNENEKTRTPFVTFIDADDVFADPFSIERLVEGILNTKDCIECQGSFLQVNTIRGKHMFVKNDNVGNPWVFGRLYNVEFLRQNDLGFSSLHSMEDGELQWKIRMIIEGSKFVINKINDIVYIWKEGSEHSITRIGVDEKGIPLYNFGNCQLGATQASINAIKFCRNKNPFNGNINKFCTEMMVGQYFTYIECLGKKPVFAEQNLYNAKRFYHECYKEIESQISDNILKQIYTTQMVGKSRSLIDIIPEITFFDFMKKIRTEPFDKLDIYEIRKKLPQEIIDLEKQSGSMEDYFVS